MFKILPICKPPKVVQHCPFLTQQLRCWSEKEAHMLFLRTKLKSEVRFPEFIVRFLSCYVSPARIITIQWPVPQVLVRLFSILTWEGKEKPCALTGLRNLIFRIFNICAQLFWPKLHWAIFFPFEKKLYFIFYFIILKAIFIIFFVLNQPLTKIWLA